MDPHFVDSADVEFAAAFYYVESSVLGVSTPRRN
jgi:hypothetical protein